MPDFRARFINLYHTRYFRPLKDHLVANVESMTPIMAKAPKIVNNVLASSIYDKLSQVTIGYVDTPLLSIPTLVERTAAHKFTPFELSTLQSMSVDQRAKSLLIVQDPFTSFYDAKVVEDFMLLVKKLGFDPILLPFKPNGKPQHVKGFLDKFAKTAKSTAEFLNQIQQLALPMVGLDASMVLCFRDEYKQILGDNRGDFEVKLAHEWLITLVDEKKSKPIDIKNNVNKVAYKLFAHCTEKTALAGSEGQWQHIFQHFGLSLSNVSVGCCGMAGTYGHEKVNLENSTSLYKMSWQSKVADLATEQVLVTGYSCRSQIKRLDNKVTLHPVQALLKEL